MRALAALLLALPLIAALSCAAPGKAVFPVPGDFAYLQVDLKG